MSTKKDKTQELESLRESIDGIDARILELINRRLEVAVEHVERCADTSGTDDVEREDRILRDLHKDNDGPICEDALNSLFRKILSLTERARAKRDIAVLGPPGNNMEAAALRFCEAIRCTADRREIVHRSSFEEIFRATETGHTHFSVVPVEDSSEWNVTGVLDRLFDTPLTICGEVNLPVEHALVSHERSLEDLCSIYAHGQALEQCRQWLDSHCPDAELIPLGSSTDAAQRIVGEQGAGAIAGRFTAGHVGIPVLADDIGGGSEMSTRFLVLSRQPAPETGNDKTSLILASRNKPGALVELLKPFRDQGVNMTWLESRPTKINLWEYMFFVDFIGHRNKPEIREALNTIREEAAFFKMLGSYPRDLMQDG